MRDADCFHRTDPDGFLEGIVDREPVACISVVRYGNSFVFLGFHIVKPGFRGISYGLRIWNAGLARLQGRTLGLYGVASQQESYRRSGFTLAWRNIRFMGTGVGADGKTEGIVPLSSIAINLPISNDRPFFADDRRRFLECWSEKGLGHTSLGVIGANGLSGYVVIRACRNRFKIGPLFADSSDDSDRTFHPVNRQKSAVRHGVLRGRRPDPLVSISLSFRCTIHGPSPRQPQPCAPRHRHRYPPVR